MRILALWVVACLAWSTPARSAEPAPEREAAYVEPFSMALRSLVWPGWGQYALEESSGSYYTTAAIVGAIVGLELVQLSSSDHTRDVFRKAGWSLYGLSAVLSSVAAYRGAEARNRENGYDLDADLAAGEAPGLMPPDRTLRISLLRGRF